MMAQKPSRICIDARLISGTTGGVEQVIIGLASGLSALDDGDEEYLFLAYEGADEWLKPFVQGPCSILSVPLPVDSFKKRLVLEVRPFRALWHWVFSPLLGSRSIPIDHSDGTVENAGVNLVHFTVQTAFLTDLPTIYQPHDLQHLHLRNMFTPREYLKREILYRTFCEQAQMVVALTEWGKQDLIKHYHLPVGKIAVVPWGGMLETYPVPQESDLIAVRRKYALPDNYVFFPSHTWPHKNHLGLLDALALLRKKTGQTIPIVFSGGRNAFFSTIQKRVRKLKLQDQVHFVGFVDPLELVCLYRLCRAVILPSKFEGWGLPVLEAFASNAPLACSNVTSLPEVAGDAAWYFEPDDPRQIADALQRIWEDDTLRKTLTEKGQQRVQMFSWLRTARIFRAHYRRILKRSMTNDDIDLLT